MKKEKKVWAITVIAFWWLAPNQMNAQQDSVKTTRLSEVVITATKFPKSKTETGKVLTVIDQDQIRQSAGKDLAQLLNEQVGMAVNGSNSNSGKDKAVYLRGASNAYTLILLDGVPLNDPSGINGGAYDLRLIPLDQIERVEILKGSQSTLYGSDAIAGVINIISKNGGTKKIEASGTLAYGSYNTFKANANVFGSTDAIDYHLGFSHFKTDGISEAKDAIGAGNFDNDGASQNSFQAMIGFKPVKSFSIKPFFRFNDFDGKYDGGALTDDSKNNFKTNLLNWGASGEYKLKKGAVHMLFANEKSDRTYDGTYGKYDYKGRFQNAEIFLNYDLSSRVQLLTGLNHQHWQMLDEKAVSKDPAVTIVSPYASLFINPFTDLTVEFGGRYNHHSKYGENVTYSFNPSYLLKKQLKVFFNLSSGFKAPSLNQLYGQYGANPNLKPERSNSSEGGVQWLSKNRKTDLRAVWFSRKVDDVIIYSTAYQYTNYDQQKDHGIELESSYRLSSKLNVQMFYAYVSGEVRTITAGQEVKYNNLLRRPKNSFGLTTNYQVTEKLLIGISAKTFGKRTDQYFDMNDYSVKSVTLKEYYLVNSYVEYQLRKFRIFVDVKNILNQKYEEVYGYNTFGLNAIVGLMLKL